MTTFLLASPSRERSTVDILVSFRGKKYRRTTKESVPVKYWNKAKKRTKVTKDYTIGNDVNTMLDKWEVASLQAIAYFKERQHIPDNKEFFFILDQYFYKDDKAFEKSPLTLINAYDCYLASRRLSDIRLRSYAVLKRQILRYQIYKNTTLLVDNITVEVLQDFEKFLREEHTFFKTDEQGKKIVKEQYRELYEKFPDNRASKGRGDNTLAATFSKLMAILNYAYQEGMTTNRAFKKYNAPKELYGSPFYLNRQEIAQLISYDLTDFPLLDTQRDVWLLQSQIGCRISDFYRLNYDNITEDIISYIPDKTKDKKARVVSVPLTYLAQEIIKKYKGKQGNKLVPLIPKQDYNEVIKEIFKKVGLTRSVIVLDSLTRKEESLPLYEVATSHLARRTFIGNLYKEVKDPNLIGSVSGHAEGSKAFGRYREIDMDIKRELIDLL